MKKSFLSRFVKTMRERFKSRTAQLLARLFKKKSFSLFGLASGKVEIETLRVENGFALSKGPLLTKEGSLVTSNYFAPGWQSPDQDELFSLSAKRFFPKIAPFKHTVVSMACPWQDAFYHWMYEVLPRFSSFEQGKYHYLIAQNTSFQKESLHLLHIPSENILPTHAQTAIHAPLILGTHTPHLTPSTLDFLRSAFIPHLRRHEKKKIYISRADASRRRVVNEEEVFGHLQPLGFEKVLLSPLSFLEQMEVFFNASSIVAPHGAGLSHLVFCDEGTEVIELFAPSYRHECYQTISGMRKLGYRLVVGEGEIVPHTDPDMKIDVKKIKTG